MKLRNGKDLSKISLSSKEKMMYSVKKPYPQRFSLPLPIMRYILMNPCTPNVWMKLLKTSKFFFSKHPVLPVKCVEFRNNGCAVFNDRQRKIRVLNQMFMKFWVYKGLYTVSNSVFNAPQNPSNAVSSFIPKMYRCNISKMQLYRQNFTLDEYEFLTSSSSFQKLTQSSVSIKYPDGSLISADKVFKNLTKTHVTEFVMWFHDESPVFLPATVKTLCQYLAQCGNLGIFYLYRLPETFDVRQISDFLKLPSNIDIVLHFEASISDECKEILSKFIKEIIENPPQNIPLIQYNEQDLDDLITLMALKRERRRS